MILGKKKNPEVDRKKVLEKFWKRAAYGTPLVGVASLYLAQKYQLIDFMPQKPGLVVEEAKHPSAGYYGALAGYYASRLGLIGKNKGIVLGAVALNTGAELGQYGLNEWKPTTEPNDLFKEEGVVGNGLDLGAAVSTGVIGVKLAIEDIRLKLPWSDKQTEPPDPVEIPQLQLEREAA